MTVEVNDNQPTVDAICPRSDAYVRIQVDGETHLSVSGAQADEVESVTRKLLASAKKRSRAKQPITDGGGARVMIDHLKDLVDRILNRTLQGRDLFNSYKEIHRELEQMSTAQFEASARADFMLARGAFEHLVTPNKHETIDATKVYEAATKLRPVLDHFVGAAPAGSPSAQNTTNNYLFHNSPTAGCAFGDSATVKADQILSNKEGDHHVGDKISIGGDAIGSAVGSHASVKARDIITQIQKTSLDNDLKQKVAEALEELTRLKIDEGDKTDVADDVEKLTKELDNPTKDESRIKKIWNRIQGAAPTVAAILAGAASLGKILGLI